MITNGLAWAQAGVVGRVLFGVRRQSAAATALWIRRRAKALIQSGVAVPMNRESATALQIKTDPRIHTKHHEQISFS